MKVRSDMSPEAEPLVSVRTIRCPHCENDVTVEPGWSPLETLWMHEYECAAVMLLTAPEPM